MTKRKTLRKAKESLVELLPQALKQTMEAYKRFLSLPIPTDADEFKEYVAKTKSWGTLIKYLVELCDSLIPEEKNNDDISALIAQARAELKGGTIE
jgi:hypothetical protein